MLETVILLTCLEATMVIDRVKNHQDLSWQVKREVIYELNQVSECKNGDV